MFLIRKVKKSDRDDIIMFFDYGKSMTLDDINIKETYKKIDHELIKDLTSVADGDNYAFQGFIGFINTSIQNIIYCPFLIVDEKQQKEKILDSLIKDAINGARYIGVDAILLKGDLNIFKKYGFKKASLNGIKKEDDDDDNLLVYLLKDNIGEFNFSIETSFVEKNNEVIVNGDENKNDQSNTINEDMLALQKKYKKTSRLVLIISIILFALCLVAVFLKNANIISYKASFVTLLISLSIVLECLGILNLRSKRKINALFGFISGGLLDILAIVYLIIG